MGRHALGSTTVALSLAGLLVALPCPAVLEYQLLKSFTGADGSGPMSGVIEANDGALYGATPAGGTNRGGTVYRIQKDGTGYAVLHHFSTNWLDEYFPAGPAGRLLQATDGMLYGTTASWAPNNIFKMNTDGSGFDSKTVNLFDDAVPLPGLIEGSDGALYGLGPSGFFNLNKNLAVVTNRGSGCFSAWVGFEFIEGDDGFLYAAGGNDGCGGSCFNGFIDKLSQDYTSFEIVKWFFCNDAPVAGMVPTGSLLDGGDGKLYGLGYKYESVTTNYLTSGIVYRLEKTGSNFVVLAQFDATQGIPSGRLVEGRDGRLYGARKPCLFEWWNSCASGSSTIFRVNKDGSGLTDVATVGGNIAGLTLGSDGAIYGTTADGGQFGYGSIFKLSWPLVITRYERNGTNALLRWSGIPNWPYRIQTRMNLTDAADVWVTLGGTNITDQDGTFQLTFPEPTGGSAKFYRIAHP